MPARSALRTGAVALLLGTVLCTCGPAAEPAPEPARSPDERGRIEERLVTELSPTDDRAGRQRNAIINRAIDRNYDVYPAPEGYFYEILAPGDFSPLATGDLVGVHYVGHFLDGQLFDSSLDRGKPLRFRVGDLIAAWNLGLLRIRPGGRLRILTPSDLAYGAAGLVGPGGDTLVPAHTPLEFLIQDIELFEE